MKFRSVAVILFIVIDKRLNRRNILWQIEIMDLTIMRTMLG